MHICNIITYVKLVLQDVSHIRHQTFRVSLMTPGKGRNSIHYYPFYIITYNAMVNNYVQLFELVLWTRQVASCNYHCTA